MKKTTKSYRIIKVESSDESSSSSESSNNSSNESNSKSVEKKCYKYKSIVDSDYIKPKNGTRQEKFTNNDIRDKLNGYISLKSMKEKKYLLQLTPFKTWIRYFNIKSDKFRNGGLLKYVDPELRYIMLVNTLKNLTWSVQLNDNIIFIPDPKIELENQKIDSIKDKLYTYYINDKLVKK